MYECVGCIYNIDASWPEFIKPCGQQNCWHELMEERKRKLEEEEYDEEE